MKKTVILLLFLLTLTQKLLAQAVGHSLNGSTVCFPEEHPTLFVDVTYKTNALSIADNVQYENLKMRIYRPSDLPAGERRPLVVLFHGGGFMAGSLADFYAMADLLARKGFVAATVQYRLCKKSDCTFLGGLFVNWQNSMLPSAYAAACDANDALRFLKNNSAQYKINTAKMLVGGHSAGAVTALNMAFLDAEEARQLIPNAGLPSASPAWLREPLEPLQNNIAGVMDFSGALFRTDWIDPDENHIPVFLAHGTTDDVVPYKSGGFMHCFGLGFPAIFGSDPVAQRLKQIGSEFYLYTGTRCDHTNAAGFLDSGVGQAFAFFVKTVFENGQGMVKHSRFTACNVSNLCAPVGASGVLPLSAAYTIKQGANCNLAFGAPETTERSDDYEAAPHLGEIALAPNPASDFVHVSANLEAGEAFGVQILDLTGRALLEQAEMTLSGASSVRLDVSRLPTGFYFVRVSAGDDIRILKLEILKD